MNSRTAQGGAAKQQLLAIIAGEEMRGCRSMRRILVGANWSINPISTPIRSI
jgi:hypothetical protein